MQSARSPFPAALIAQSSVCSDRYGCESETFLSSFSLLSVGFVRWNRRIAIDKKDPELKVCKHQCKAQLGYDERERLTSA